MTWKTAILPLHDIRFAYYVLTSHFCVCAAFTWRHPCVSMLFSLRSTLSLQGILSQELGHELVRVLHLRTHDILFVVVLLSSLLSIYSYLAYDTLPALG